ncbi:hypothetical protein BJ138DRAFT_1117826 [Hygrophoropsis aurantiaca]|uniref:Uncharacterized protein n=1 Tax=Hygrophoropsis aurantiaca TaxID=72124 RepID=A0ACB7ZZ80_9AGAM|nr:hypothetical protein BJ138DRAFT_1117826 [Hygrophoropsis aurantiaca]
MSSSPPDQAEQLEFHLDQLHLVRNNLVSSADYTPPIWFPLIGFPSKESQILQLQATEDTLHKRILNAAERAEELGAMDLKIIALQRAIVGAFNRRPKSEDVAGNGGDEDDQPFQLGLPGGQDDLEGEARRAWLSEWLRSGGLGRTPGPLAPLAASAWLLIQDLRRQGLRMHRVLLEKAQELSVAKMGMVMLEQTLATHLEG